MDASIRVFRNPVLLLMSPILAAIWATPGQCLAGGPTTYSPRHRPFFDGSTLCAWHRTWHGPNVLATPLRGYYIPRKPACCGSDYAGHCGDLVGESCLTLWELEGECEPAADCCPACMALEPAGMERLGQVPNDLELSAGAPGASPNQSGR
jgi:hypothetical protein